MTRNDWAKAAMAGAMAAWLGVAPAQAAEQAGQAAAPAQAQAQAQAQAAAATAPVMPAATAPASGARPAAPAVTTPPARIETSVLAERPFLRAPRLSPDGLHFAGYFTSGGNEVLGVYDPATGKVRTLNLGDTFDFNWFKWAGNNRLLISVGSTVNWEGDDAWQTRLITYDITTGQQQFIGGKTEGLKGDDVLWIDPEGNSILLAYQQTIYDYPSVSSIDLATNHARQVVAQRTDLWDWYADDKGVVRAGFVFNDNSWKMIYRASAAEGFRTVVKAGFDDDDAGFDAFRIYQGSDEGFRLMLNEATGRYALYRFNFATRKRGELMFEAPGVDISDFDTQVDGANLYAAWYVDDHARTHWFDAELGKVQEAVDKAVTSTLGNRSAQIVSYSRDRGRMLIWLGASNDPGRYYLLDQSDGAMHLMAKVNEKLDPRQLATTSYITYKARDGLDIPAYLTLPLGRAPSKLPLVIMPHGGPYDVRDEGDFDTEVQFLANRGYAVLQPEFRGSGGYGKAFYEKGEGQWGRAMQDDLDDGMDWLAKLGTIDPARVCLVGSSYGGYAALWGAVRNPERYRCAASFAGISDLKRQLKFQIEFKVSKRYRKDWQKTVQGADTFDLTTVSPLFTIDRLKTPVLLVHGDKDQRVPYKQSKLYADALQAAHKPYEFVTLKGEGHGFSTKVSMQTWLDRLDAFLARYNPTN